MNIQDLRDILISIYLVLGIILSILLILGVFLILKAILGLIKAAKRPLDNLGDASNSLIGGVLDPSKEGLSLGTVLSGTISFGAGLLGLSLIHI